MSDAVMHYIDTMSDGSEIVHYEHPGIPLYIHTGLLSVYPGRRARCHWHDDIELMLILSGDMNYYVNGEIVPLHTGDAILVNARQMHYGYAYNNSDSSFICILFHPSLLSSCPSLEKKLIDPFLSRTELPYLYLDSAQKKTQNIRNDILRMWNLKDSADPYYELRVISILYDMWADLCSMTADTTGDPAHASSSDVLILRRMVTYIHDHYRESIALSDIAAAGNICNSKCCAVFKSEIHQSPFDFLNTYRLQLSADLLKQTDHSVTDIATDCGFNHLSYYSKLFLRYFGCTPREYRSRNKDQH